MIMNLGSKEIYQAIIDYVGNEGISLRHKKIEVEVKSGRKGNGPSAIVTITAEEPKADTPTQLSDLKFSEDSPLGDLS